MISASNSVMLLVVITLTARILFPLAVPIGMNFGDAAQYHDIAINIAAGNGARLSESKVALGENPFIHNRSPAYGLFIAAFYRLFGPDPRFVFSGQSLIDVMTVLLIHALALRWGLRQTTATGVAGLFALYPIHTVFAFMLLTETLFTFFALLALFLLTSSTMTSRRRLALTGFFLGLAVIVRTAFAFFPFFLALLSLPRWSRLAAPPRRFIAAAVILAFSFAALPTLQMLRNHAAMGAFILGHGGGWTLYESNNPIADGGPAQGLQPLEELGRKLPPLARDRFFQQAAVKWIRTHPGDFLSLMPIKFIRFWNIVPNFEQFRRSPWFELSALFHIILYGLALAPWLTRRGRAVMFGSALPALLFILYFTLLHMVFLGSIRYRVPIMPQVFLFAGLGAEEIFAAWRAQRAKG